MQRKILPSLSLILLLALLVIPDANAGVYTWNMDSDLVSNSVAAESSHWVTNGYWDVKGFQWDDLDTHYSSGFDCVWQNGVVTILVEDWEHDGPWQGYTVGTVRQGSVWNLSIAPWYDQTTYQPTPLHFLGSSSIDLNAGVRIDSQHRTALGWINWLFNPWFSVKSTYGGITRVRRMVWDIVWAYNSWLGTSAASPFVDEDENLHLDFYVSEMAQTGEWKTYTIDLLGMAQQARDRAIDDFDWHFSVDDLFLWSIEVNSEGWDYGTQFSVDFLEVTYTTPPSPTPANGLSVIYSSGGLHVVYSLLLLVLVVALLVVIGLFLGGVSRKRAKSRGWQSVQLCNVQLPLSITDLALQFFFMATLEDGDYNSTMFPQFRRTIRRRN